mgnify:CR=1 FL=1
MPNAIGDFFSALAPEWDAMEETPPEKIDVLLSLLNIKEGDEVLDVGCGTGIIIKRLADLSKRHVIGVDVSSKMIEIAREKYRGDDAVSFLNADFLEMGFGSAYDYVVIYNAYPHFPDKDKLRLALEKALKPGGKFAIVHSLSRAKLNAHHAHMKEGLASPLRSTEEESRHYGESFKTLRAEEDDEHYLLIEEKIG